VGDTLMVRMLSRHVTLPPIERDIRQVVAVRPWMEKDPAAREPLLVRQQNGNLHSARATRQSDPLPIAGGQSLDLQSPPRRPGPPDEVKAPRPRIWSMVRRVLAEGRDRLAPFAPRSAS